MCIDHNVDTESLFKLVNQENQQDKEKLKNLLSIFIVLFIKAT